ncbi:hypothetical protein PC116_g31172 [Phytophthora cactorum]|nr:hypothetical protein PC112_g24867 [Phytophthora cactorum]KAG4220349.1 hypothetical protein PC116_g31172 [Phytophthora cactorum]
MALDAAEPWRNCRMEQPHRHPFNTIFLPCNPTVCIFVPQGQTPQSVGSSIVIDDCVAPREVAAGLDRDWNRPPVALEASHGAASGTSSAAAIYHVHPRHSTSVEFGFAGLCCGYVDFHWCHTDFCGCCVDCYRDLSVGTLSSVTTVLSHVDLHHFRRSFSIRSPARSRSFSFLFSFHM